MDFVVIDVETANPDMGSICQIGVAVFAGGQLAGEWSSLIDPEDYFHDINVSVHGIDSEAVRGKPTLTLVAENLRQLMHGQVCVSHMPFDRTAIARAFGRYSLEPPSVQWLDSAAVARRTWADIAQRGYGLKNLCQRIGYEFRHHDALEDAKAAGYVLLAAMRESQQGLEDLRARVRQPIDPSRASWGPALHRDGNPDGPLHGEVLVFTGSLQMPRAVAADLAARVGCQVAPGVTKKTTILVVGDQDVTKLAGHERSSKHRKAEDLAMAGSPIRIIRESDFDALVSVSELQH